CAATTGDLETVKRMVTRDPSLVRAQHAYRRPLYFAVRENRVEVAAFLLEQGADPLSLAVNGSLLEIAHDRGYAGMQEMLETTLARAHGASPRGETVAASIRERDAARLRGLLDASPDLLHAGDG